MRELVPAGGALVAQLQAQAESAAMHEQLVLVVVGSPSCGPCLAFQHALAEPVMVPFLKSARVVHLDERTWARALTLGDYLDGEDLPQLFLLTPNGRRGATFDKGRWSDSVGNENVQTRARAYGPPLQTFVADAKRQQQAHHATQD